MFVYGGVSPTGPTTVPAVSVPTLAASRLVATPLDKLATGAKAGISIAADPANTKTCYVGGPTCTVADGFPIPVGGSMTYPARDPYAIFCISGDSGQVLRVTYL